MYTIPQTIIFYKYGVVFSEINVQLNNEINLLPLRARFQQHRDASCHQDFFLQGKAPKEIHTILTETLARFLLGRAKDLSAPLYKAIPVQVWTGPEGCRRLRVPEFRDSRYMKVAGCQSYVPAAFAFSRHSWYSFLLQAESTPGS